MEYIYLLCVSGRYDGDDDGDGWWGWSDRGPSGVTAVLSFEFLFFLFFLVITKKKRFRSLICFFLVIIKKKRFRSLISFNSTFLFSALNAYRTNFSCCARNIQGILQRYRLKKLVVIKTAHYSKPTLDDGIFNEVGALGSIEA